MKRNKKQKENPVSTVASLPKELQDRIVVVGAGIPLNTQNGTCYNPKVGTSDASSPFTSDKMFPNPTTTISQASEPKKEKIVKEDISITINFGTSGGKIKTQLKEQGFKFDKHFIKGCEAVRLDLLALLDIDILTMKQGQKAFSKLNTMISNNVIEETFGDVNAKLKKTFVNNKEVK